MAAQYRWVGHVTQMEDTRLPKSFFIPSSNTVYPLPWHSAEEVQRYAEDEHESLQFAAQRAREPRGRQVILAVLI